MTHRIVIVGAGYAGLATTTRLARRSHGQDVRIELVNAGGAFVERVRLHQLAAGTGTVEHPLVDVLSGTDVHTFHDRVTALDLAAGTVSLASGGTRGYDTLVYALGSRSAVGAVPGADRYAYTLDGTAGPTRLAAAVADGGPLVVCGGGLTGIEVAAELAETYPELPVTLVTRGEVGYCVSARGRDHIRATLRRLGVEVLEHQEVAEVTASTVELVDGTSLPSGATVWAGSFAVPELAAEAGLATDGAGRVAVGPSLRSVSHPSVFAVGDAAAVPLALGPHRMSCAAGMPAGLHAADVIAAGLRGRETPPHRFQYTLMCVSIGRRDGLIQFVHGDDSPRDRIITGRTAARVKEYVCRGASWAARSGRIGGRAVSPGAPEAGAPTPAFGAPRAA